MIMREIAKKSKQATDKNHYKRNGSLGTHRIIYSTMQSTAQNAT